ncbi:MAG: VanZ family protein [Acidobacteria bacterium]|nr:VanZ family protein [Acidobacteriota bacterium]
MVEPATPVVAPHTRILGLLRLWGPLFLWWLAILGSGGDGMAAGRTSRFVEPLVRWFWPDASEVTIAVAHIAVRKLGHVLAYALVGMLAFRAVRAGREERFRWTWAAAALAIGAALAATDELRQSFVASRSGTLGDVAIDVAGCGAALLALAWWRLRNGQDGREGG